MTKKERIARARKAGLVGGPARARSLSKARRSEIASRAAKARWYWYKKDLTKAEVLV